jgi:Arc/MetJ family transcription regulator
MRTTLNIDEHLLAEASKLTGEKERTRLLHDGLRALIARENARAIVALGGSDPGAWVPARRQLD